MNFLRQTLRAGKLLASVLIFFNASPMAAQDDVMMQAFYWDVPVDAVNKNGTWWDNLRVKSDAMKKAGFKALWVPSPAKGNFGIYDMGYGIFDHYDLGNYNQKGTVETRFGSRKELQSMITRMHNNGIQVYADIVLNHLYTSDAQAEPNPAVKKYVFDEAYRNNTQYQAYPANEIQWVIPKAAAGDYYIQIKGYLLPWNQPKGERGYDIYIDWTGAGPNGTPAWEAEPNNGSGHFNIFPGSGRTMQAHIESQSDIDEYKITLTTSRDIVVKLVARREKQNPFEWTWAPQENGYYPVAVWHNGTNLAATSLQARTNTGVKYVTHTGAGEPNYSWNYTHFHPADNNDWLGFPGSDEIITNTKMFGIDINTYNNTVQTRFMDWGKWLVNEIGFDGFRLDFVRGFQEPYVSGWVKSLPLLNGQQRFIVGEYWGSDARIKNWVNTVASDGADVDGFDFPLKNTLNDMCNGDQSSFDMKWLNHAGMVRNNSGNALPGTSVVTFVDNHDTGKEHDKWITKDFKMAYAYMLSHEGRPCVFYSHYFGVTQVDAHNSTYTVQAPASLQEDINKMMFARRTYMGGTVSVLSQTGNPYPAEDAYHVYVARRQGNGTRNGAIIVINNHNSGTKGLWVNSSPSGHQNWTNAKLVNAFNPQQTTQVQSDGRVYLSAPPRGYAVWVKESEYVAYPAPAVVSAEKVSEVSFAESLSYAVNQNHPNPLNTSTTINFSIPDQGNVMVSVYDAMGRLKQVLVDGNMAAGMHEVTWNAAAFPGGTYLYTVVYNGKLVTKRMIVIK